MNRKSLYHEQDIDTVDEILITCAWKKKVSNKVNDIIRPKTPASGQEVADENFLFHFQLALLSTSFFVEILLSGNFERIWNTETPTLNRKTSKGFFSQQNELGATTLCIHLICLRLESINANWKGDLTPSLHLNLGLVCLLVATDNTTQDYKQQLMIHKFLCKLGLASNAARRAYKNPTERK